MAETLPAPVSAESLADLPAPSAPVAGGFPIIPAAAAAAAIVAVYARSSGHGGRIPCALAGAVGGGVLLPVSIFVLEDMKLIGRQDDLGTVVMGGTVGVVAGGVIGAMLKVNPIWSLAGAAVVGGAFYLKNR